MLRKFIAIIFLQVLVLLGMAISHYAVEWYGEEVHLKTAPVDPRDLFYGDYVTLNYEISEIHLSQFKGKRPPKEGDTVYVLLKKEGDYHQLVSASLEKPSVMEEDEQVVKGRVNFVTRQWDPQLQEDSPLQSFHVLYGFERYYVPEGTGKELENKRGQFDVIVKVASWGQNLSSLTFIANDVMTEWEARDRVFEFYKEKGIAVEVNFTQLTNRYENQERPVWLLEVVKFEKGSPSKMGEAVQVAIDAKTGEIIAERK
ncbi:GDYXXLXY domain-containing protein [Ammoniphilus resinae]|uniref:Membrane-anchored protein n=1 Tax=Ammoniphilus resinae TaxID=861532 RepID=A0ABS4GMC7_9BACL|nr:GDYXXLXY domain-containing protein [Ammoniphilus resinae]MBP1931423.1 putative membrane-anchored protein [Ammoniphilus resinae]